MNKAELDQKIAPLAGHVPTYDVTIENSSHLIYEIADDEHAISLLRDCSNLEGGIEMKILPSWATRVGTYGSKYDR
jgi:hypothetical protein